MRTDDDFELRFDNYLGIEFQLPKLPLTLLEWTTVVRPEIDGQPYSFIPYQFWVPIYRNKA